jgi:4'-phosphopantetheinyl transferase
MHSHLSVDERHRADQFRFERDRARYVLARGQLRLLLGKYLRCGASAVSFEYSRRGKPRLTASPAELALRFNLSHSGDWSLIAVSADHELGVDLEILRNSIDFRSISHRYFSPTEIAALDEEADEAARLSFFRYWTRKEALAKARGESVWTTVGQFVPTGIDTDGSGRFHVYDIDPIAGYVGTVVALGSDSCLICWRLPEEWLFIP